jgi:hypothetical protein
MSLVKFTTGISSSIVSLIFGLHTLSVADHDYFWHFASVLAGVALLGLFTMFVAIVQNRLYFVYPTRQVNAIRRAMLTKIADDFSDNQMYLTTRVGAFKLLSLHTVMNLLVAMQVGAFAGLFWFSLTFDTAKVASSTLTAVMIAVIVSFTLFCLSGVYLTRQGRLHPDVSVHKAREPAQ